jgi:hypothetical protein
LGHCYASECLQQTARDPLPVNSLSRLFCSPFFPLYAIARRSECFVYEDYHVRTRTPSHHSEAVPGPQPDSAFLCHIMEVSSKVHHGEHTTVREMMVSRDIPSHSNRELEELTQQPQLSVEQGKSGLDFNFCLRPGTRYSSLDPTCCTGIY